MNANHEKVVQFIGDDGRRVYAVPVKLVVECTLFILAIDDAQASRLTAKTDLNDYFSFDRDSVTTDGENLLRVDDVIAPHAIDVSVVDIRTLDTKEYPPNEHPDFVGIAER
jgi:hypothetical protein